MFQELADAFQRQSYIYTVCYIILIYFFCYFWTAITFNPKDMAENLKDYGSFIPGYRPGRRTADYLEKVMLRITYVGAAFLALVAVIPSLVQAALGVDWTVASFLGGTGLLIVISVCLDLVQKIDSHLVMRNYTGLVNRKMSAGSVANGVSIGQSHATPAAGSRCILEVGEPGRSGAVSGRQDSEKQSDRGRTSRSAAISTGGCV